MYGVICTLSSRDRPCGRPLVAGTTTAIKTRLINEIITDMKQKAGGDAQRYQEIIQSICSGASTQIQQFKLSQEAEEGILDVIINVMQDNE